MKSNVSFGIVIPTKNRFDDCLRAIKSSVNQSQLPAEIVIIDQSVDLSLRDVIESYRMRFIGIEFVYEYDPKLSGLTAAKNKAIRLSKSDILLFIDDDIVLDKQFVEILTDRYRRYPNISGFGGCIVLPEDKTSALRRKIALIFQQGPFKDMRSILQAGYFENKDIVESMFLSGGLSSLRREVFDKVLFNDTLTGASPIEDLDFYSRACKYFKFALVPQARALHNVSPINRQNFYMIYKRKVEGFIYIYDLYIDKKLSHQIMFMWRCVGVLCDSFVSGVVYKSFDPVKGFFRGLFR